MWQTLCFYPTAQGFFPPLTEPQQVVIVLLKCQPTHNIVHEVWLWILKSMKMSRLSYYTSIFRWLLCSSWSSNHFRNCTQNWEMRRCFQSLPLLTATAKAHCSLSKAASFRTIGKCKQTLFWIRTSDLMQEENQQLTFLKSNLIQDIPVAKNNFTTGWGNRMKGPKHSIWKTRQQKQGREKEMGAAPDTLCSFYWSR